MKDSFKVLYFCNFSHDWNVETEANKNLSMQDLVSISDLEEYIILKILYIFFN